jgi:hypothetical protein
VTTMFVVCQSVFGGSLVSGVRICVLAFGRNMTLVAVKILTIQRS